MARRRRCSEAGRKGCAEWLPEGAPAGQKTCSEACKSARGRRMKAAKKAVRHNAALPPHMKEVAEVVTDGVKDAAHTALVAELQPVVREALTDNVLRSIESLVGLSATAIEKLKADIEGDDVDPTIRQRAYTLLLKYTMGNPSVAPPPTTPQQGGLTVNFQLPRPGDATAPEVATVEAEGLRACADCGKSKAESEFVASSDRCEDCHAGMQNLLVERFGDAYKS